MTAAGGATGSAGGNTGIGAGGSGATAGAGGTLTGYFVSPDGNDANPGTMSAPFQSITKARDVVRTVNANMTADVNVYLRGGIYNVTSTISFGPQDSGTNGHRIIYQAYPGETPILNGATKVSGWTLSSGNVYKASLNRSTKLRNLYVNDARATLTSKTVTAQGGSGTYAVTSGQATWAWASGMSADGVKYAATDVPEHRQQQGRPGDRQRNDLEREHRLCPRRHDELGRLSRSSLAAAVRRDRAAAAAGAPRSAPPERTPSTTPSSF